MCANGKKIQSLFFCFCQKGLKYSDKCGVHFYRGAWGALPALGHEGKPFLAVWHKASWRCQSPVNMSFCTRLSVSTLLADRVIIMLPAAAPTGSSLSPCISLVMHLIKYFWCACMLRYVNESSRSSKTQSMNTVYIDLLHSLSTLIP